MRPISLILGVFCQFVDLMISRNDRYIRVRRVNLDNVENLSTITCVIIKYHFVLNSRTGNKHVIFS